MWGFTLRAEIDPSTERLHEYVLENEFVFVQVLQGEQVLLVCMVCKVCKMYKARNMCKVY